MKHTAAIFASPYETVWLVPLVLLVNLSVFGLVVAYSFLNLLPDLPATHRLHPQTYFQLAVVLVVIAPTAASTLFLWPLFGWLRRGHGDRSGM